MDTISILAGGVVTYTLTGTIPPSATGTVLNAVDVVLPAGQVDPTPGNNHAEDETPIVPEADLSVTKTDGQHHGGSRNVHHLHDRGGQRRSVQRNGRDRARHAAGGADRSDVDLHRVGGRFVRRRPAVVRSIPR